MQSETGKSPHLKNKFVNLNYVANQCTMGPPLYTGSSSMDLNHCASKILKKNPETFKKQSLNLRCTGKYLHYICIVFTTIYVGFALY